MKKFRVVEIFGPTIQGEGRRIGTPCHFIRFGGCDYRCTWCDSPHAVLPELVSQVPLMSEKEITDKILALPSVKWIVFSGGNPALFDLTLLMSYLTGYGRSIMLETQGTEWKPWINFIDDLCVSPKPPSSLNMTEPSVTETFLFNCNNDPRPYLKIVVFDDEDYLYAIEMVKYFGEDYEVFLSVGNEDPQLPTVGHPTVDTLNQNVGITRDAVLNKMRWLMEKVASDIRMRDVRVLPQMHVLAWGNERGR